MGLTLGYIYGVADVERFYSKPAMMLVNSFLLEATVLAPVGVNLGLSFGFTVSLIGILESLYQVTGKEEKPTERKDFIPRNYLLFDDEKNGINKYLSEDEELEFDDERSSLISSNCSQL